MTIRRTMVAAGMAALMTLALAGSTVAIGDDEEDPEVAYCQSLVELSASVEALGAIDPTSTVEDFEAAVDRVEEARASFEQSLRDLVESQIETLETAVDGVRAYRDSIEDEQTIEEVVAGAAGAVAAVGEARAQVGVIPNCAVVAGQEVAQEEAEG
jgi:hypothetical protein